MWPSDINEIGLLAGVAVLGAAVGFGVAWALSRRNRPLKTIGENLETLANQIEFDLLQLQLEDAQDGLSQGWNRLLAEAEEARQELEAYQLQQQAMQTVGEYQSNWVTELLNKMTYGLLMVSEDLKITFANATAERMLSQSEDELLDQSLPDVLDASLDSLRSLGGGTMDRVLELESQGIALRLKAVRVSGQAGDGQIALFLQDMSHQKEMERARDQFLYHITHELRTPLTNIRAYAETLSEGVLEDRDSLRECYNVIIGETERLSHLVEDILSVSQLEAGSARLTMGDVQTARLVRQVVEDQQAAADAKNIELGLSLPSKVPTIRGDKDRLAVVLTNLVGNAVKYTPEGGQVEVSCVEDGARLLISVRDTGYGIAPEDQDQIFEKFYRAETEETAQLPGTGLGLAIAKETVRSHGGTIELESERGKGSTFTISLPIGKQSKINASEDD